MIILRSGGKERLTLLINDESVCRTAQATPGLLNMLPGIRPGLRGRLEGQDLPDGVDVVEQPAVPQLPLQ